jgi:hypothetical protein
MNAAETRQAVFRNRPKQSPVQAGVGGAPEGQNGGKTIEKRHQPCAKNRKLRGTALDAVQQRAQVLTACAQDDVHTVSVLAEEILK